MIKRSYFLLFVFLLIVAIAACLFGCRTSRDNKAVARVISSQPLSDKVFAILAKSHPCNSDSVFIPGQEVIIYDTTHTEHYDTLAIDSIHQVIITKWRTNTIVKYVHRVDTVHVTSERDWKMCNDSLQSIRGRYAELQTQFSGEKKGSAKKTWWIVGLIVLIAGGIFLRIKKII